ncbi:hypothetical protein F8388_011641, partial [Cannabis sativa]
MPDGASRRRSRRGFHGTPGLGRDLGNVVILGTVKTDLGKTLSFIVHVSSIWCCCCYFDFDVIEVVLSVSHTSRQQRSSHSLSKHGQAWQPLPLGQLKLN